MEKETKLTPSVERVYIIFQRKELETYRWIVGITETEELAQAKIDEIQKKYKDRPAILFYHEEWMTKSIRNIILSALNPVDEYENGEDSEEEYPWYVERWYEDDIINGLESLHICTEDLTREQMHILREELRDIFDNKEDRNVLLQDTLDMLKDKYDWLYKLDKDE